MRPAPLTPQPVWHHLPRLAPESYRGFAVVLWTLTLEHRATGWLDESLHLHFREWLLHAAAREGLFCPVYVLMPDHLHLLWMGLRASSDQRNAMKFLRKHLAGELARRSPGGVEFQLQKQAHDRVLREKDRMRGAFEKSCFYILNNPRRKELVDHPRDWPHLGAVVPGHPFLQPLGEGFWEQFWKLYQQERERRPRDVAARRQTAAFLPARWKRIRLSTESRYANVRSGASEERRSKFDFPIWPEIKRPPFPKAAGCMGQTTPV